MALIDELLEFLSQDKKQLHNFEQNRPVQWLDDGEAQKPNPMMELEAIAPTGPEVEQSTDDERAPINKAPPPQAAQAAEAWPVPRIQRPDQHGHVLWNADGPVFYDETDLSYRPLDEELARRRR